jgi:thioredoxin reductase (NADPH)
MEQKLDAQALFTTRGDIVYNDLARNLGAELDATGQIVTDLSMRTSVKGLYAAGCVTTANCQMIIAAGQGATAAQAINRELFEETWLRKPPRQVRRGHTSLSPPPTSNIPH